MKLPDWAPQGLLQQRRFIAQSEIDFKDSAPGTFGEWKAMHGIGTDPLNLIDALLSDPRMESVWRALKKRFNNTGLDYSARLWQAISWEEIVWFEAPKIPKKEAAKIRKQITNHARALEDLLWRSHNYVFQFMPEFLNDTDWDILNAGLKPRRNSQEEENLSDESLVTGAPIGAREKLSCQSSSPFGRLLYKPPMSRGHVREVYEKMRFIVLVTYARKGEGILVRYAA